MPDDDLNSKLSTIERDGKARFGDDFDVAVAALKRAVPNGFSPADMAQIAAQPDAAGMIMQVGRHQLINEASDGNTASEAAYRKIRQAERDAWKKSRR
jgi:hypothetical protein